MLGNIMAICFGAGSGALLRWQIGLRLNLLTNKLAFGTLFANLLGGFIIGLALGLMAQKPELPTHWRLLFVTGFCGSLTTFSTFSAEVIEELQRGRIGIASMTIFLHVAGSLALTLLGLSLGNSIRIA